MPHKPKPQIPLNHQRPPTVICLGLPRCATTTLKQVLESPAYLDVGPCMHMSRCLPNPAVMKLVHDALLTYVEPIPTSMPDNDDDHDAEMRRRKQKRQSLLRELFKGAAATTDFPGHLFVEDLVDMYPHAKFILNLRPGGSVPSTSNMAGAAAADADAAHANGHTVKSPAPCPDCMKYKELETSKKWAESMSEAIAPFTSRTYQCAGYFNPPDRLHYQTNCLWNAFVRQKFGVRDLSDPKLYIAHNEWCRKTARARGIELLEWEPGMGWEPLTRFLAVAQKKALGEVPRINERGMMKMVFKWRVMLGVKAWSTKVVLPALAAGALVGAGLWVVG